ncbi:MAG: hypothetical protein NTX88_10250 [Candidatus Atribacteria bacterium]|nr:hypothetical protein [Candidatus Atribacteria bacterium]
MNRMGRMIVFCLIFFMFWEGSALALLSQPISPEEVWLTVYQGMDKGWVVEKMTFLLNQGENHFFFSGQNLLQERFYLHPFESDTSLKTVSTVGSSGYRITLEAGKKGTYPFLISFFENGFDWMERYM